jgi:Uma2 family endonuclease
MPLAPQYFTADMVRALPEDGQRYEVVHGELLVTPAPTMEHQRIVRRLLVALDAYCTRFSIGEAFDSPADISWDQDTLVQPDVFVVVPAEAAAHGWSAVRTLLLVAEVMSPSTARGDRFKKRRLYQEQGVGLIWLVDPVRRAVEIWGSASTQAAIATDVLRWEAPGAAEPLVIHLADLFA